MTLEAMKMNSEIYLPLIKPRCYLEIILGTRIAK